MSTLQVANIHLESTGNNRIQYTGSNGFLFVAGGSNAMIVNTSAITYSINPTFTSLTIGNSVITNTSINATSYSVGTSFTANSTLVNAVSISTSTNTVTFGTTFYSVANGNIGIGNTSPAENLHVQGNIVASGDITSAYSDERLKNVIGPITNSLEKVNSLSGFYYRPNETALELYVNDEIKVGVSAQQVQKVLPEVVKNSAIDPKYLTVQYEKLVPLLIEAIKELTLRVEKLENGS